MYLAGAASYMLAGGFSDSCDDIARSRCARVRVTGSQRFLIFQIFLINGFIIRSFFHRYNIGRAKILHSTTVKY